MLKKEVLAYTGKDKYHFKFKIGQEEYNPWYIGFRKDQAGVYSPVGEAQSPIPYWTDSTNYLNECMNSRDGSKCFCKSKNPKSPGRVLAQKVYRVDEYGNTISLISDAESIVLDVYSSYVKMFSDNEIGNITYLKFDPPPTGYLNPETLLPI